MRVTKFPQSCLVLEKDGQRLAIDVGSLLTPRYSLEDLGQLDAVLYTHEHPDHYDPGLAEQLAAQGVKLYANQSVARLVGQGVETVTNRQKFEVAGFAIEAYDLPHCKLTDGSDGPPNTGFIVDGTLFHPGDGDQTTGLTVPDVALPIAGPTITLDGAVEFARSLGAKRVIPIHYDNVKADPVEFDHKAEQAGLDIQVIVLENGQSAEL